MPKTPSSASAATLERVARLAQPVPLANLSWIALRTVSATRLIAVCARGGRDPLVELTQRLGDVTTARVFLYFANLVGAYWPEDVQVMRPCCCILSPDEMTLALMADCAATGRREEFSAVLDGFVRSDRHEELYDRTTVMIAHLQ
ncbi:DNA-directed RNA polymerase subunit beta' [Aurantiacibacter xanthus]|uniref:DNA-directed RNA polymerase subunit beta n=1 Tax=Aurantiacibacter xanthus TaxID=1784712 RepID=A0A3A1P188_9SPHN|nr:DNA-directed RNA polymerase subunit beta' [Aurantiacibacter xanthus]RIV82916.1 DNA-directed RNA polymerase subunit beta' [Aurantiacibacter xanthus]